MAKLPPPPTNSDQPPPVPVRRSSEQAFRGAHEQFHSTRSPDPRYQQNAISRPTERLSSPQRLPPPPPSAHSASRSPSQQQQHANFAQSTSSVSRQRMHSQLPDVPSSAPPPIPTRSSPASSPQNVPTRNNTSTPPSSGGSSPSTLQYNQLLLKYRTVDRNYHNLKTIARKGALSSARNIGGVGLEMPCAVCVHCSSCPGENREALSLQSSTLYYREMVSNKCSHVFSHVCFHTYSKIFISKGSVYTCPLLLHFNCRS